MGSVGEDLEDCLAEAVDELQSFSIVVEPSPPAADHVFESGVPEGEGCWVGGNDQARPWGQRGVGGHGPLATLPAATAGR